jgi:putative endonuclease
MIYYVYILECADKTLYTGYTNYLDKRLKNHNEAKKGAKYTRSRLPVVLKYSEKFETLSEALKREIEIKNLTRKGKLELIKKNGGVSN